jgi:hypothetical protein
MAIVVLPPSPTEPVRPDGLIERLPAAAPVPLAASYQTADGGRAPGDRRRRRRAKGEPWRGRFIDTSG